MYLNRHQNRRRVVITGMGWVTPLGHAIEQVWARLLAGDSGVARTAQFDASAFPTTFSAEVKSYDLSTDVADAQRFAHTGRLTQFLLGSAAQAWHAAGLDRHAELDGRRVGLYLASGEGSLDFEAFTQTCLTAWNSKAESVDAVHWAQEALARLDALRELEQEPNMALARVAALTGARGPAFNTITACAASTQAIGEATEILRHGDADVMIAGGGNSMIHPFGITGFNRLTTLSTRNADPAAASRPFDLNRDGFVIGEGAGIVILEALEHAVGRGAPILAEVIGYGSTADAFRVTDQHPDSAGSIEAMRRALASADIAPADVDYVNAHGTGTRENDRHETHALHEVFGAHAAGMPISSIKSMLGHLITAAGAVELIACVLAIRDQVVPPTTNLDHPDPACDLDYVPNVARRAKVEVALSNNLGFGGQNDAVVLRRYTAAQPGAESLES
jgi:3-oxoacyl-[acyl-carrier-protein] synthase II